MHLDLSTVTIHEQKEKPYVAAAESIATNDNKKNSLENHRAELETILLSASNASIESTLLLLNCTLNGISAVERRKRLVQYGRNTIQFDAAPSWQRQLIQALLHPFNFLLCILAIISASTGDFASFTVMLSMIFLSVSLRFSQERKATISAESLKRQITHQVKVRSPSNQLNYSLQDIDFEEIVPGDIIHLASGSLLPCDGRVVQSTHLHCNQTILTGESMPIVKDPLQYSCSSTSSPSSTGQDKSASNDLAYLRRTNLCFYGSTAVSGAGVVLALTTGNFTYFGFNAHQLVLPRAPSAFAVGVKRVSFMLVLFSVVMVPSVLLISGLTAGDWTAAALFAAAAAVGLTPEMLPMIVNSNLALGAYRMAKEKCLIKRLEAIQNLGAIDILCSDKTGTLTNDHVSLFSVLDPKGNPAEYPRQCAFVIASFQEGFRNVLDEAILQSCHNPSVAQNDCYIKLNEIPFDFNRKRMAVVVRNTLNNKTFLFCKGAQEQTCDICSYVEEKEEEQEEKGKRTIRPITAADRESLKRLTAELACKGLRVLAVAGKEIDDTGITNVSANDEDQLILYGFLTFLDPPKPDAALAIQELCKLNVQVKILTGDNPFIARQVCNEMGLGINDSNMLTSPQLRALPYLEEEKEFALALEKVILFAGLSPDDKACVVRVLRLSGRVVGFLGDGLNDGLALKESDVGISVDTGSDLAKDAADVILTEKSLSVLAKAVRTGRITHGNTIKYIKMAASSNFGNVFSLLFAAGFLPFTPMQPLQLLIQNLLYDFSQISIPWDTMDPEYLVYPKSWSAKDLARFMCVIGPISSIFDICIFMLGFYFYGWQSVDGDDQYRLQTMWFIEGLLTQTFIVHMIRTEKLPFFQSRAHPYLLFATLLCCVIGIAIPNIPPIASVLHMIAPPASYYGFLFAIIASYTVLIYFTKRIYITLFKVWL